MDNGLLFSTHRIYEASRMNNKLIEVWLDDEHNPPVWNMTVEIASPSPISGARVDSVICASNGITKAQATAIAKEILEAEKE